MVSQRSSRIGGGDSLPECSRSTQHRPACWRRCRRSPRRSRSYGRKDRGGWGRPCGHRQPRWCGTERNGSEEQEQLVWFLCWRMKLEVAYLEELGTLGGVTWIVEISDPVDFFFGFLNDSSFCTLCLAHLNGRQGTEYVEGSHIGSLMYGILGRGCKRSQLRGH